MLEKGLRLAHIVIDELMIKYFINMPYPASKNLQLLDQ